MSLLLCVGPVQSAVAADKTIPSDAIVASDQEQVTVYSDDSRLIVKEKRAVSKEDFPVIPEVGKKVKLKYPDKVVEIETLAAGCQVSFAAYTPYKWDNRGRGDFQVSASSGCPASTFYSALLSRGAAFGGFVGEATKTVQVYSNYTIGFAVVSRTCQTGNYTSWRGSFDGAVSNTANLPCQFYS